MLKWMLTHNQDRINLQTVHKISVREEKDCLKVIMYPTAGSYETVAVYSDKPAGHKMVALWDKWLDTGQIERGGSVTNTAVFPW